jgi:hypothetical protein
MVCACCKVQDTEDPCPQCNKWVCSGCLQDRHGELVCVQCAELLYDDEHPNLELSDVGDQEEDA